MSAEPKSPIRLIVANGCSMTYGDELLDRLETAWVALLARQMGADFVNLGACAGSNHRIVRTSVEHLPRLTVERGLRPDQVLFLAMWSRMNRFELYSGEPDRQGGLPETPADAGWCRIHPAYIERRDARSITWYRHLQHDVGDLSAFLLNWLLLDGWLVKGGYHYGYLWAFEPHPRLFTDFPQYTGQLDLSRVIGSDRRPAGGPPIFDIGQSLNDLGPHRHPLERSQEVFVDEYVHDWVIDLLRRPGNPATNADV